MNSQHFSTKERILGAAEQLFARLGFAGASLRQVTAAANVNLAAVNYHFGSKENLINEVFRRRLDELNAQRLQALEEALTRSPSSAVILRELAEVELDAGRADEADAHVRQALDIDGGDAEAHRALAEILEARGMKVNAADVASFRQMAEEKIWPAYKQQYGEMWERVAAAK